MKNLGSNALLCVCLVGFVQNTPIFWALIFMFFLPHRQKGNKVAIQLISAEMPLSTSCMCLVRKLTLDCCV